eukprot:scaffold125509_cov48-Phaeocystis_antarctica.AAC.1
MHIHDDHSSSAATQNMLRGSAAKAAGWLAEAGRSGGQPQACSAAESSLRSASRPKPVRPSCCPACPSEPTHRLSSRRVTLKREVVTMSPPGARSGVAPSEADIAIWRRSAHYHSGSWWPTACTYNFASSERGDR